MRDRKRHRKKAGLFRYRGARRKGQSLFDDAFVWDFRRRLAGEFHLADVAAKTFAALSGPDESFPIILLGDR